MKRASYTGLVGTVGKVREGGYVSIADTAWGGPRIGGPGQQGTGATAPLAGRAAL